MRVYDDIKCDSKYSYVALGSFDGLHLGHLSLIEKAKELAFENNGKSMVFTFKNHPRSLIRPSMNIELLMTNEEKVKVLEKEKVDILAFKTFDESIMTMKAEDFIKWLCDTYKVKGIVVGFNFKFGYKNLGDVELLQKYQEQCNYKLYVMKPYKFDGEVISSTRIRNELLEGNVEKASAMLSRPYSLSGIVVDGRKIGRKIGFPTANLISNNGKVIPAKGVYYTNVEVCGKIFKGITSIGNNPTVNGKNLTIETFILDFNSVIYGYDITLYFISKIRDEVKFDGINDLINQLKKDKAYAMKKKIIIGQETI